MLFLGLGKDEDVIQLDEDEAVEHVPEHVIHQSLEDGRGIGEAEGITPNAIFHSSPSLMQTR